MTIDLNCDMGELADSALEDALLAHITSANIACGAHAGDAATMERTAAAARRHGVAIGAHPGYPDRENFGRIALSMPPPAISETVYQQIQTLAAIAPDVDVPLYMDGRTIILQAARKIPRAITELLERNRVAPESVSAFLMHQANLNLIVRVAQALAVPEQRFYRNIQRYGNTSSASMLIAAAEWRAENSGALAGPIVFAAFGAGLHWGALLAG